MRIGLDITNNNILVVVIKKTRRRLTLIARYEHSYDQETPGDLLKQLKTLRGSIIKRAKQTIAAVTIDDVLQKNLPFDKDIKEADIVQYVEENINELLECEDTLFYFDITLLSHGLSQNIWTLIAIDQSKLLARAHILKQAGFQLHAVDVDQLAYQRGKKRNTFIGDQRYLTAFGLATWREDDEH